MSSNTVPLPPLALVGELNSLDCADARQIGSESPAGPRKILVPRDEDQFGIFQRERRGEVDGIVAPETVLFGEVAGGPQEVFRDFDMNELPEQVVEGRFRVLQLSSGHSS